MASHCSTRSAGPAIVWASANEGMRVFRSTTWRFAALVFILQLLGAGLILLTVQQLTRLQIATDAQDAAEELRDELLDYRMRGGPSALIGAAMDRAQSVRAARSVVLLVGSDGRRLAGNLGDWPPGVPVGGGEATIELFRVGNATPERMRVVATALPDGARLLTGHVIESELQFALVMEDAMLVAFAFAAAMAAFAAWISARLIEARLRRTVATAQAVAAGDLDHRVIDEGGGDAFEALGHAVNAMLDRIAALMTELKVATDGLAHDLRSPLTRLRSTLERALERADSEEARLAVARAVEEGDRLLAMLDTALRISRAEAGLGREAFVDTDVGAMLADVVEMYEPLVEDRGATIRADVPGPVHLPIHRELLSQALANLIDNALKYGGRTIVVGAAARAGGTDIWVADDGPGIAPDRRGEALRRFGRLDAARSESGAGLGLSLASAVARLHGGGIALEDNEPGLVVRLSLSSDAARPIAP